MSLGAPLIDLSMSWGDVVTQELGAAARPATVVRAKTELDLLADSSRDGINLMIKQSLTMTSSYAAKVSGAASCAMEEDGATESVPFGNTPGKAGEKRRTRPSEEPVADFRAVSTHAAASNAPRTRVVAKRGAAAATPAGSTLVPLTRDARVKSSLSFACATSGGVGSIAPAVFDTPDEDSRMPPCLPTAHHAAPMASIAEATAPVAPIEDDVMQEEEEQDGADFTQVRGGGRTRSGSSGSGKLELQGSVKKARMTGKYNFAAAMAPLKAAAPAGASPASTPASSTTFVPLAPGSARLHAWQRNVVSSSVSSPAVAAAFVELVAPTSSPAATPVQSLPTPAEAAPPSPVLSTQASSNSAAMGTYATWAAATKGVKLDASSAAAAIDASTLEAAMIEEATVAAPPAISLPTSVGMRKAVSEGAPAPCAAARPSTWAALFARATGLSAPAVASEAASSPAREEGDDVESHGDADESMIGGTVASVGTRAPIEELTEHRIQQREKQIAKGKATEGYQRYVATVPREARVALRSEHPNTPDITARASKRQWDGIVRVWRRRLHVWDADAPDASVAAPSVRRSPRVHKTRTTTSPGLIRSLSAPVTEVAPAAAEAAAE